MLNTVIGLDLAATFDQPRVGVAILRRQGGVFALVSTALVTSTEEILNEIKGATPPALLAIDAPLKLPVACGASDAEIAEVERRWNRPYSYRPWEYLVFEDRQMKREYAISGRPFSSMVLTYRGQILMGLLQRRGWNLASLPQELGQRSFTEVFPNLTLGILQGPRPKDKHQRQAMRQAFVTDLFRRGHNGIRLVNKTGKELPTLTTNGDVADAIICAWTGSLLPKSDVGTGCVGIRLGDMENGFVMCPYTAQFERLLKTHPDQLTHSHLVF